MDSYEIIREIGKGSYGVVWLVKHIKDEKSENKKNVNENILRL